MSVNATAHSNLALVRGRRRGNKNKENKKNVVVLILDFSFRPVKDVVHFENSD
jgi:hypothetical protein